jgi:hypothetical protein
VDLTDLLEDGDRTPLLSEQTVSPKYSQNRKKRVLDIAEIEIPQEIVHNNHAASIFSPNSTAYRYIILILTAWTSFGSYLFYYSIQFGTWNEITGKIYLL